MTVGNGDNGPEDLKQEVRALRQALEEAEARLGQERARHAVRVDRYESAQERRVSFVAGEPAPHRDQLPALLDRALFEWLQSHPGQSVRSVLGIVHHGATARIHLWYDEEPAQG